MPQVKLQSGIIMTGLGKAEIRRDLNIPSPDDRELLVRTHAVALNPPDWMALDGLGRPGAGLGFDFAGEVVEIGDQSQASWAIGDRVAGFVHACHASNYCNGAFREYLTVDANLVLRIPKSLSFAEASTLGMGVSTAAQALYQSLPLPLPTDASAPTNQTVLIYGGSTATGSLAIQLAKLSGLRVIATCSKNNISWIQSLGPDEVIDYKSPDSISSIRSHTEQNGLHMILDCVATDETASFCYQCFSPGNVNDSDDVEYFYASLMPIQNPPTHRGSLPAKTVINSIWKMVYTCFGRRFSLVNDTWGMNQTWEASPTDKQFMVSFYRRTEKILARNELRPMPIEIKDGGLDAVLDGVSIVRRGGAHGKKLVYTL